MCLGEKYVFYNPPLCLPHEGTEVWDPGFASHSLSHEAPCLASAPEKLISVGIWVPLLSWSSQYFKRSACNAGFKCYFNSLHITRLPFFPGHPGLKATSPLTCLPALSSMSIQFLHNHFSFPGSCHWPAAALTPPACHSLPTGLSESKSSHNPKPCLAAALTKFSTSDLPLLGGSSPKVSARL